MASVRKTERKVKKYNELSSSLQILETGLSRCFCVWCTMANVWVGKMLLSAKTHWNQTMHALFSYLIVVKSTLRCGSLPFGHCLVRTVVYWHTHTASLTTHVIEDRLVWLSVEYVLYACVIYSALSDQFEQSKFDLNHCWCASNQPHHSKYLPYQFITFAYQFQTIHSTVKWTHDEKAITCVIRIIFFYLNLLSTSLSFYLIHSHLHAFCGLGGLLCGIVYHSILYHKSESFSSLFSVIHSPAFTIAH